MHLHEGRLRAQLFEDLENGRRGRRKGLGPLGAGVEGGGGEEEERRLEEEVGGGGRGLGAVGRGEQRILSALQLSRPRAYHSHRATLQCASCQGKGLVGRGRITLSCFLVSLFA